MPFEDYGFGSKNTGNTYSGGSKEVTGGYSYDGGDSSPSIIDRITSFFTRDDDPSPSPSPAPQPVSGGRGNVYERPNERNDYLAAILQQQSDNAVIPMPSQPPIPQSFRDFNQATGNMFKPVYDPQTGTYRLSDSGPNQQTLNQNDITAGIVQAVPPNWRDYFMIGGQYTRSLPHAFADNVIGLNDGYESAGEIFGQQLRENPLGTLSDVGLGAAEGLYNLVTSPIDTTTDYFNSIYEAATRNPETTGPDQRLADLATVASVIPAAKLTKGVGSVATAPVRKQAARFNDPYMESERLLAARGLANVGTDKNPKYTGVGQPSFIPDPRNSSDEVIGEYRGRQKFADALYQSGATDAEVIKAAGINRVTYKTPSGGTITRDFMLLSRPEINLPEAIAMINETRSRLKPRDAVVNPDGTVSGGFDLPKQTAAQRLGERFLEDILNNPEDFKFLESDINASDPKVDLNYITVDTMYPDPKTGKFREAAGTYTDSEGSITYNPTMDMGLLLNRVLPHEIQHAIDYRGDPSFPREGRGGISGAETYMLERLVEIDADLNRIDNLLDDPDLPSEDAKILSNYKSDLLNESDVLGGMTREDAYYKSPIEVIARGSEPGEPLMAPRYDVPFTALFNPLIKGQQTPISKGIGALIKDYQALDDKTDFLKNLNYYLNEKGYGQINAPIAYEEMVPYRVESPNRPDRLLGPRFSFN